MLNSHRWKHLSDRSIILALLEVIVWLLLVICYGLLVPSFAIVNLHLWVLEVLHTFLLLKWTMWSNCSNNCCLLCCSTGSHGLELVRSKRHVKWIYVSIIHGMTSICEASLRDLISTLKTMACHLVVETHHIIAILVQHRVECLRVVWRYRDLVEHLWRMIRLQLKLTITAYLLKILALEHLVIIMVIAQVDLIWRQLLRMLIFVDVFLVWLFKSMTLCHYSHCLLYIDRDIWLVSEITTRFRMSEKFRRAFNCDLTGR